MVGLGHLPDLDFESNANGVSADGSVVVGYSAAMVGMASEEREAFRWTEGGGMHGLGDLPGGGLYTYSGARAVSADGSIVVGYGDSDVGWEAVVWDATHGMRTVQEVLDLWGVDIGSWQLEKATGVSADGTVVVGYGTNPEGNEEAWRAVIPEPSAFALAALGLLGVQGLAFGRRRSGASQLDAVRRKAAPPPAGGSRRVSDFRVRSILPFGRDSHERSSP